MFIMYPTIYRLLLLCCHYVNLCISYVNKENNVKLQKFYIIMCESVNTTRIILCFSIRSINHTICY